MNTNDIITRLKKGDTCVVACSMYEETYWYDDGSFKCFMENGIEDPLTRIIDEEVVRRHISQALRHPDIYEVAVSEWTK